MSQDNMEQMGEHCFVLINQMSFKGINQPQKLTNEHVWEQRHHKHTTFKYQFIMNLDYPKHRALPSHGHSSKREPGQSCHMHTSLLFSIVQRVLLVYVN